MPERRDQLHPDNLALLLEKLDEVMAEAARLRREVTRQLSEQRRSVEPRVTPTRKKTSKRR